jgi:hypothetical protein
MESNNNTTFLQALKGGAIAGAIGAILNSIWNILAGSLGATIPPGFAAAVVMASIVPMLAGAVVYFLILKYSSKGKMIWLVLSIGFTLYSFYPVFTTHELPDGTVLDSTFPLLTGPMHAISGFLAAWAIPKFSK